MSLGLVLLTALALSMDSFAVSVSCGISGRSNTAKLKFLSALSFGIFQGIMPLFGYMLSNIISGRVETYSGIIAFVILAAIGIKMVIEAIKKQDEVCTPLTIKSIFMLSIATSIDAFATGIGLGVLHINIFNVVLSIGLITFVVSLIGAFFGEKIGTLFKKRAEMIGGIVLILIGLSILLDNL